MWGLRRLYRLAGITLLPPGLRPWLCGPPGAQRRPLKATPRACRTRVCAVSVEAAFSKAGIELSGALEVVAEPHFEAPEQVDFDGCVRLTVRPSCASGMRRPLNVLR